jgi:hypothetical protein
MADISSIVLVCGDVYNFKDTFLRNEIENTQKIYLEEPTDPD